MADRNSAVLARSEWLGALRELSVACCESEPGDAPICLREMNALLLMTPHADLLDGVRPLGLARLEVLIEADACETAVMAMLDCGAGYLVSRSGDGQSLATVALPDTLHDESGAGATPALALIGALALSLSTVAAAVRPTTMRSSTGARMALH